MDVKKRLKKMGNRLQEEYGLSRQAMWKIRVGESGTVVAEEYWERVRRGFPEFFPEGEKRHPGLVMASYLRGHVR